MFNTFDYYFLSSFTTLFLCLKQDRNFPKGFYVSNRQRASLKVITQNGWSGNNKNSDVVIIVDQSISKKTSQFLFAECVFMLEALLSEIANVPRGKKTQLFN